MADEYSDDEDQNDKPYSFVDNEGYVLVPLEAINKIRETIGKPSVGEKMVNDQPYEEGIEEEIIEERMTEQEVDASSARYSE